MKKSLLFLVCCLGVVFKGNSQTYQYIPFPDSNAVWFGETWYCCPNGIAYWRNHTDGDTILNGLRYIKFVPDFYYSGITNTVYYREDSLKRIYFRGLASRTIGLSGTYPLNDTIDYLVYDFGKNLHDTIPTNVPAGFGHPNEYVRFIIDSIDTINMNGKLRKRFYINAWPDNVCCEGPIWIEGIGSTGGLPIYCGGENIEFLHCFNSNGSLDFWDGGYCILGIEETLNEQSAFSLFPNPATNQLNISIDESLIGAQMNIYNLTGALVQTVLLSTANSQLSTGNLPNGVYIAEIKTKEARVMRRWVKM